MRNFIQWTLFAIAALAGANACHGQCAQLNAQIANCTGPNNCSESIPVNIPSGSEYGLYVCSHQTPCCSGYLPDYYECGNCQPEVLRDAKVKQAIAELAQTRPILVASCNGEFQPYQEPAVDLVRPKAWLREPKLQGILN